MSLLNASHKELKEAVKNDGLVIFAGAGISKSVGLPLWEDLILKIIEHINTNNIHHGDTLKAIFKNPSSKNKIFDTLNYIERNKLKDFVNHILKDEIYEAGKKLISENAILQLHSKLWQLSKKIITPNYDMLFESCNEFKVLGLQSISNKSIIPLTNISKNPEYLLKIHGTIINELDDIIFYENQYENQYKNDTAVKTKFKELVANHPILFVGTSMTDPYINEIIQQVNSIFHSTAAKNFILSNEEFETAEIIKILGNPITDLNSLLDELISIKGGSVIATAEPTLPKRIKTLKSAITDLHNNSLLFPDYEDFENGTIQLNESLFNYAKNRFESKLGPILCQGRWATGKTVSTLRIAFELTKSNFTPYYLDLADDIAGHEENIIRDYLHKILEKFNSEKNVFIIDNVHLFPEQTYKISQWAINSKCNCIFVGRPLSHQFKEKLFFYPLLFEQQKAGLYPDTDLSEEDERDEILEEIISSPKITFKPSAEFVQSIFKNKLNSLGRKDKILLSDVDKFAESISYNLSFIAFHISKLSSKTVNIYEINYELLYDFIDNKFHLSEYSDELFTIAALSFLDCKIDCAALFLGDKEKQTQFKNKQDHLFERRNFIFGMHSATGRLILDTGIKRGLIRTEENTICYNFDSTLKFLLEKYLLNKPLNIYEIFFGLSNYEYEASENNDDKTLEEARELIYYFLTNPKLNEHYADVIIHRTNSLLRFGFFVKSFLKHKVEQAILHSVINEINITKLVATFIEYSKTRHGGYFSIGWHFKYAWVILRKADKNLAEFYLKQFPKEAIIKYSSMSIGTFSSILEMALYHDFVDEMLFTNEDKVIGDDETFKKKFKAGNEIKIFFFMRTVLKMSSGNFKNQKLLDKIKSIISPKDYRDFVKSHEKITILSFVTARRALGRDYFDLLQQSFDKDFLYKLSYDKPLAKIYTVISESGWEKFLRTDFPKKLETSFIEEISTFIRNIALHGTHENFIEKLVKKLYEEKITNLLIEKLLDENIEYVFHFFWQLKTLNVHLFNLYFNSYCSKTENEFEPLKIERTKTAISFLLLIYYYSYNINSKSLLNEDEINSHIKNVITNNAFVDKVFLSALFEIFNLPINIPYNGPKEKIRGIHFAENLFQTLENERNRFDVYDALQNWWQSKILLLSASVIGINRLDKEILKENRFERNLKSYLYDLNLLLKNLEDRMPEYSSRTKDEIQLSYNKISILKMTLNIFK